jgi:MoxR-like ATPase
MKGALSDVKCPNCQRIYKLNGDLVGQKVRCRCGHVFRLADEHLLGEARVQSSVLQAAPADASYVLATPPTRAKASSAEAVAGDDIDRVKALQAAYERMTTQLSRVIVGQSSVIEEVLIAIFCRGHVLLVGVPGVAKTLLVSTLARVLDLGFKRIQFTPDLMPSDITGTDVLEEDHTTGKRVFRFVEGPLFTNMVLADEINRTPPKTQAALLEAMQERHVTVGEGTYMLPAPFFVLATQNPIEQEGTYPLPEAQLDRFLFNTVVDYPQPEEEFTIIRQVTSDYRPEVERSLNAEEIVRLQEVVLRVPAADHVIAYARDIARATRPREPGAAKFVKEMVSWGAGPRAGISLIMAAKARAILRGRYHATTEDVKAACLPVLRHRVVTTFNAEAAGVTSDQIVKMILDQIAVRKD